MSWLTEYVRPKIRTLFAPAGGAGKSLGPVPGLRADDLPPDLEKNLKVCPHCGHHMRATALERLGWTFDEGS